MKNLPEDHPESFAEKHARLAGLTIRQYAAADYHIMQSSLVQILQGIYQLLES